MQLNFKKYGNTNESIIILHGFLGSLDNWHTLSGKFAENYTVYNLDQRNHGKSPHAALHNIESMTDDLVNFMHDNQLGSSNIIGHSMGGKVAMQFALKNPNLVNKLIVADIAPRQYQPGHDAVFKAIFAIDLNTIGSRKEAEEAMLPFIADFGTRQFLLKNLDRNEDGSYSWKLNLKILHRDYDEIIKEINSETVFNNPTLFLKGGNSNYIQQKDLPQIAKLFTNYTIQTIPNAGHWLHAEQPELFYNAVTHFLS